MAIFFGAVAIAIAFLFAAGFLFSAIADGTSALGEIFKVMYWLGEKIFFAGKSVLKFFCKSGKCENR